MVYIHIKGIIVFRCVADIHTCVKLTYTSQLFLENLDLNNAPPYQRADHLLSPHLTRMQVVEGICTEKGVEQRN